MSQDRRIHYVTGTVITATQTTQVLETFIQPGVLHDFEWVGNFFSLLDIQVNWCVVLKRDGTLIGTLIGPNTSGNFYAPAQHVIAFGNVVSDPESNTFTNKVEGKTDTVVPFARGDEIALVVIGEQGFDLNFVASYHTTT